MRNIHSTQRIVLSLPVKFLSMLILPRQHQVLGRGKEASVAECIKRLQPTLVAATAATVTVLVYLLLTAAVAAVGAVVAVAAVVAAAAGGELRAVMELGLLKEITVMGLRKQKIQRNVHSVLMNMVSSTTVRNT